MKLGILVFLIACSIYIPILGILILTLQTSNHLTGYMKAQLEFDRSIVDYLELKK